MLGSCSGEGSWIRGYAVVASVSNDGAGTAGSAVVGGGVTKDLGMAMLYFCFLKTVLYISHFLLYIAVFGNLLAQ